MALDPDAPRRRPPTDAEARALASSLRLRILRMCLDEPRTNAQLAERLGMAPATVLHHVRTLTDTGFLEALPAERGRRGSRPRPYRATGKSWWLDGGANANTLVQAFIDGVSRVPPGEDVPMARLGLRLSPEEQAELAERLQALADEYARRPPTPGGRPVSLFMAVHPDTDRD
ncbi:ArsR/SmtB family transcription factor [Aquipuribacter sp. SD81]|uniref:ArsR/SmtB family transcription factor n=1 Tax=Aquipuribacter sp. SD81 TaxID=3127703 RepID=UPI003017577C